MGLTVVRQREPPMSDGRYCRQVAPADVAPELIVLSSGDRGLPVDETRLVTDGGGPIPGVPDDGGDNYGCGSSRGHGDAAHCVQVMTLLNGD
ncbi:hypothetical protein HAH_0387 [Haloarcula hispanica ATCC 33960]|uniref:Uncharacterized protein n=3 Tax=Haloarcula hispanica TaxID=51589 RepID=G0HSZ4_HALHT|nr:hypothetical protein HAH_0387 [Haloarcula hispanica ATCC 33960]